MDSIGRIASGITPVEVVYESSTNLNVCGPNAYAIQAIEDTTFSLLTVDNLTGPGMGGVALSTKTLLAGHIWYLNIRRFTLATGSVLVYKYDGDA